MKEKIFEYIKYNKGSVFKIAVVVLLLIVGLFVGMDKESSGEITVKSMETEVGGETLSSAALEVPSYIFVDISGAVKTPGVLKVEADTRVYQAIQMSGGLIKEADPTGINMAAKLEDEDKIYVPEINEIQPKGGASYEQASFSGKGEGNDMININKATNEQLQELTGVGPSTAGKIISYRESYGGFKTIEDIKNVSGIGEKTFAKFRDNICI